MAYIPGTTLTDPAGILGRIGEVSGQFNGLLDQRQRILAGRLASAGDYEGAERLLNARGLFDEAAKPAARGREVARQELGRSVLGSVDRGDYAGARAAAAEAGEGELYGQVQSAQAAEAKRRGAWLINAAGALRRVPVGQRAQAFAQFIEPTMRAMGVEEEILAQMRNREFSDQELDAFQAALGQEIKYELRDGGAGDVVRVRADTGEAERVYDAPDRPIATQFGILMPPQGRGAVETQPGAPNAPAAVPSARPATGFTSYGDLQSFVSEIVPGVRFTSGERSRAEQDALISRGATNAQNSAHLPGGLGQDIVPSAPRSEWPAIAQRLKETGRFRRVIIEDGGPGRGTGPHIHLEPIVGGPGDGAPTASAGQSQDMGGGWTLDERITPAQRRQEERDRIQDERADRAEERAERGYTILSPEEARALGLDAGITYQRSPQGQISPVGGQARGGLRPVPVGPVTAHRDRVTGISKIDQALADLRTYPQGVGMIAMTPDFILQRTDPDGVRVRAALADIGSLIIHDRSGAAVTASEYPRLKPFIPLPTDSAETARTKLIRLREILSGEAAAIESDYSEAQGYRGFAPENAQRQAPPTAGRGDPPQAPRDQARRQKGKVYRTPKGDLRWTGTGWVKP